MISLDQVILLEQKVESAVAKIQQLKQENDALRRQCLELTNALSAKSEQLSSFEIDQNQIEDGIKKALDRLNSIENSVLKASAINQNQGVQTPTQFTKPTESFQDLKPVAKQAPVEVEEPVLSEQPEIEPEEDIPEETDQIDFQLDAEPEVYSQDIPEQMMDEESVFEETSVQIDEVQADNAFNNEMFQQPEEEPEFDEDSEVPSNQSNFGFDIF